MLMSGSGGQVTGGGHCAGTGGFTTGGAREAVAATSGKSDCGRTAGGGAVATATPCMSDKVGPAGGAIESGSGAVAGAILADGGGAVRTPDPCRSDVVGTGGGGSTPRTDGGAFTGRAVAGTLGIVSGAVATEGIAFAAKVSTDGPLSTEPGNPATGGGVLMSGVLKALNMALIPLGPCVKFSRAVRPTFDICDSSTGVKPSVLRTANAFDAYNSNPIIPNRMSMVVPGFMVSCCLTWFYLKLKAVPISKTSQNGVQYARDSPLSPSYYRCSCCSGDCTYG